MGGYFWGAACFLPTIAGRSLFFVIMAPFGGVMLGVFFRAIERNSGRDRAQLWFISIAAWATTFVVNRQVFHRYFEPITLVFLVIGVTLCCAPNQTESPRLRGRLIVLVIWQLGLTLLGVGEAFGWTWLAPLRR